jgi:predicted dehydrogenase
MPARIGIIGAGFWAAYFYLPFFRDHPDVELVGVVRRDRRALEALRREYDLEVASDAIEDILGAACDGLVIASPHALHRQHAVAAMEAGAHVLVEKPMTVSLADAIAVEEAARRTAREVVVAYGWNFSEITEWGADAVGTGLVGRPTWVTGVMSSSLVDLFSGTGGYGTVDVQGVTFEAQPETWADPAAGGGYTYGQLSHVLGVALALVKSEPARVYARANFLSTGVDVDIQLTVEFVDGVVGAFSGHGRAPWGVRYPLEVRLAAENGVMTLDFEHDVAEAHIGSSSPSSGTPLSGEHAFRGRQPDAAPVFAPGTGLYSCEGPAQWFVDTCLGGRAANRAPVELGRRAVAIMEAAVTSARSGEPVEVSALT